MSVARELSRRSSCSRLHVGCFAVSPDYRRQVGWGYNGGASGQQNECASLADGACLHVHAEVNMICNATMVSREEPKYVFVTDLPCVMCAKCLVNWGGVKRVVYDRDYRIRDSLLVFEKASIEVVRFSDLCP